jgi:hypothetical protein
MFPIEGPLVADATRNLAHSALPGAPQVPDKPAKVRRSRRRIARMLRALADRLEPPRCVDVGVTPGLR